MPHINSIWSTSETAHKDDHSHILPNREASKWNVCTTSSIPHAHCQYKMAQANQPKRKIRIVLCVSWWTGTMRHVQQKKVYFSQWSLLNKQCVDNFKHTMQRNIFCVFKRKQATGKEDQQRPLCHQAKAFIKVHTHRRRLEQSISPSPAAG